MVRLKKGATSPAGAGAATAAEGGATAAEGGFKGFISWLARKVTCFGRKIHLR